jgi:hypothetical protein
MSRRKKLLLLLVLLLLSTSILARRILSPPPTSPPGIPESWKRHQDTLGNFELWLPEEWENPGHVRTAVFSIREVADGIRDALVLSAVKIGDEGVEGWVTVRDFDVAFDLYAPLVGTELAIECSRNDPVLPIDFVGAVRLDASNVVVVEKGDDTSVIAYQSGVYDQSANEDIVRAIAYAVSSDHVYQIKLHTIEMRDSTDTPTYEKILEAFRILR